MEADLRSTSMSCMDMTLNIKNFSCRTPRTEADLEGTSMNRLDMLEAGRAALPFQLTTAQERVLGQVRCRLSGTGLQIRVSRSHTCCSVQAWWQRGELQLPLSLLGITDACVTSPLRVT